MKIKSRFNFHYTCFQTLFKGYIFSFVTCVVWQKPILFTWFCRKYVDTKPWKVFSSRKYVIRLSIKGSNYLAVSNKNVCYIVDHQKLNILGYCTYIVMEIYYSVSFVQFFTKTFSILALNQNCCKNYIPYIIWLEC